MTTKAPEDFTLEEIKEQLALYNRLYYQKRRHEKEFMETKRTNAIKYHRRKKLDTMIENGEIDLKDIDYEKIETEGNNNSTLKKTKPRKYKGEIAKILTAEA